MSHARRSAALVVLAIVASLTTQARQARASGVESSSASAASAASSTPATAESLFREGRKAADAGHYAIACARFEQSNRLDPAPGTLLNLADCQENLGQLTRAWRSYRELYDELPASDPRRALAETRASALERRTPKLRINLVSTVPATVTRDDTVVTASEIGVLAAVDPGRHVVIVSCPDRPDRRYEVVTTDGQDAELTVSPSPAPPSAPPLPAPPPPTATVASVPLPAPEAAPVTGPSRKTEIAIGAVGAASLLTGAAFGVVALTQLSSSNGSCSGNVCASQSAVDQYNSARSFALAADITLGVGIACLGTAIVMELIHPRATPGLTSQWSTLQAGLTF